MREYKVTINTFKVGMVYANNEREALHRAIYLYGMNCDVGQ